MGFGDTDGWNQKGEKERACPAVLVKGKQSSLQEQHSLGNVVSSLHSGTVKRRGISNFPFAVERDTQAASRRSVIRTLQQFKRDVSRHWMLSLPLPKPFSFPLFQAQHSAHRGTVISYDCALPGAKHSEGAVLLIRAAAAAQCNVHCTAGQDSGVERHAAGAREQLLLWVCRLCDHAVNHKPAWAGCLFSQPAPAFSCLQG